MAGQRVGGAAGAHHVALLLCQLALSLAAASSSPLDAATCGTLGFSETLMCSGCDQLAKTVGDAALTKECRSCCTDDSQIKKEKYKEMTLEFCTCKIARYPEVKQFLDKYSSEFPKLKVVEKRGADPVLYLKAAAGGTDDTLAIGDYKTEEIVAYLKEKLELS